MFPMARSSNTDWASESANFWIGPVGGARATPARARLNTGPPPGKRRPGDYFKEFKSLVERFAYSDTDLTRGLFDIACHLASIGDCPTVVWEMRVARLCLSPRCKLSVAVILSVMIAQALRNTRLQCAPQIMVMVLDHMGEVRLIVRDNGLNCYDDYASSIAVIESLRRDLGAQVTVHGSRQGRNEIAVDFLLTDRFRG